MKKNGKKKGFTLVELIVVIAIIGILAAVTVPKFSGFQDKARATQALVNAKAVATAVDALYAEKGSWPTAVADVAALSGVAQADITLDTDNDGGFVVAADGFKAGRDSGTAKVESKGK